MSDAAPASAPAKSGAKRARARTGQVLPEINFVPGLAKMIHEPASKAARALMAPLQEDVDLTPDTMLDLNRLINDKWLPDVLQLSSAYVQFAAKPTLGADVAEHAFTGYIPDAALRQQVLDEVRRSKKKLKADIEARNARRATKETEAPPAKKAKRALRSSD